MIREPRYQLGEKVYFNLYDGGEGIVIDITWSYRKKEHSYLVATGFGENDGWYLDLELTDEKQVI